MHDDLDRPGQSTVVSSARTPARFEMLDVIGAIHVAERLTSSRVLELHDGGRALTEAALLTEKGDRACVIAPAEQLAGMRDALRRIAASRLAVVAHALAGHGAEELVALSDLGWGVLVAAGPEDSLDLTLVARRAAEDSGVPFLVVHGLARQDHPSGRAVALVQIPPDKAVQSFVGPPGSRTNARAAIHAGAIAGDRSFAERVPFALGAALREYGDVSGRRHDAFDKAPLGESPLMLVGTGPVGDALLCATTELRARGYDVGAIHITSLRPFPGPKLVKALARALAITILEPVDEPLTHGALLARDVKSAFTDALTWVPGFPGIGRIPKLFVGATGPAFDITDLAAVCENMLADERGRRVFSFSEVDALPSRESAAQTDAPHRDVALRFVLDDAAAADAVLAVLASALVNGVGLRSQGIIAPANPGLDGGAVVLDVLASRDWARGGMARRAPKLVLASERGVTSAGAVVALAEGAILGVLGESSLPEAARKIVREKRARVLPLQVAEPEGERRLSAISAACAGAALAVAASSLRAGLDGASAARLVMESMPGPDAEVAGQRGRRAFEATRDALSPGKTEADPMRPIGNA